MDKKVLEATKPIHIIEGALTAMATAGDDSPSLYGLVPKFQGLVSEDGNDWLMTFTQFCEHKTWTEAKQAKFLPLLLKGMAFTWYSQLPADQKDTFPALKAAFQARFCNDESLRFARLSDLYGRQQQPGESLDSFLICIKSVHI